MAAGCLSCLDHHSMIAHKTITEGATCVAPARTGNRAGHLPAGRRTMVSRPSECVSCALPSSESAVGCDGACRTSGPYTTTSTWEPPADGSATY